MIIKGEWRNW